jgi:hypothetical protein
MAACARLLAADRQLRIGTMSAVDVTRHRTRRQMLRAVVRNICPHGTDVMRGGWMQANAPSPPSA